MLASLATTYLAAHPGNSPIGSAALAYWKIGSSGESSKASLRPVRIVFIIPADLDGNSDEPSRPLSGEDTERQGLRGRPRRRHVSGGRS